MSRRWTMLRVIRWTAFATLALSALAWWGSLGISHGWESPGGTEVCIVSGCLAVNSGTPRSPGWHLNEHFRFQPTVFWRFLARRAPGEFAVVVPLWAPAVLSLAVLLLAGIVERMRKRGNAAWSCAACGYDRAGIAADAPCPECGAAGPIAKI